MLGEGLMEVDFRDLLESQMELRASCLGQPQLPLPIVHTSSNIKCILVYLFTQICFISTN